MSQAGLINTSQAINALTFTTDLGAPVHFFANNVNVLGSTNISTSGLGSTITIDLKGLTQYNVLSAASSDSINNIAPSTAGFVLTSNGPAAQPTFQASAGGSSLDYSMVFLYGGM